MFVAQQVLPGNSELKDSTNVGQVGVNRGEGSDRRVTPVVAMVISDPVA